MGLALLPENTGEGFSHQGKGMDRMLWRRGAWPRRWGGAQGGPAGSPGRAPVLSLTRLVFQSRDMRQQFLLRRPAAEIELQHFVGPDGRLLARPHRDQQAL